MTREGSHITTNDAVKTCLLRLYDELFSHEGYGDLRLEMRILQRGQKEVIVYCGKQFRFVVDFRPSDRARHVEGETRHT